MRVLNESKAANKLHNMTGVLNESKWQMSCIE